MPDVIVTIGYQSATRKKPGQLVRAFIVFAGGGGEEPVGFQCPGFYLNDRADARTSGRSWRAVKLSLSPGDSLRIDALTGVKGAGEDSSLTGSWIYVVDPDADIKEIRIPGVGPDKHPLLKGRLVELAAMTKRQQLDDELQQFFDDEEGM